MSKLGNGIDRNSARPLRVRVGSNGEYWLCDEDVSQDADFAQAGCVAHSSIPMAEGG